MVTRRAVLGAALAAPRVLGANDRIRIGIIGNGGMANAHVRSLLPLREQLNIEFATVCDVYQKRLDAMAALTGAKKVRDYRSILDDKDIDYVLIATPEHWHYQMAMDAVAAGKHVYCEKPMTQTPEQARKLVARVKANPKIKFQVGVQGMSDDSYETAYKFVQEGALGKVVLAQIDYSRNHRDDFWTSELDPDVKPGDNLDWRAWLGPAPKREFDADRFQFWRRYWDYSGGIASDLFVHRVTRIIKSLGLTYPEKGVGFGGKFNFTSSPAEIPDTLNILLDYPGGPTVQLISSMANDTPVPHLLRGHKATLEFTRTGFTITPQRQFENEAKMHVHIKSGGERTELHHQNLLDAIRNGAALKCDCELGMWGVLAVSLGNESYRRGKVARWDNARGRVISV
ncbi:MAG: Gfo/Idh/MocA family oxidoreductase [Bryobacteraceae bacterium]|nr:Gfo/Idh/MocA family oxidoreductase [Bryobacteraceae bacterium]